MTDVYYVRAQLPGDSTLMYSTVSANPAVQKNKH